MHHVTVSGCSNRSTDLCCPSWQGRGPGGQPDPKNPGVALHLSTCPTWPHECFSRGPCLAAAAGLRFLPLA